MSVSWEAAGQMVRIGKHRVSWEMITQYTYLVHIWNEQVQVTNTHEQIHIRIYNGGSETYNGGSETYANLEEVDPYVRDRVKRLMWCPSEVVYGGLGLKVDDAHYLVF